MPTVEHTVVSNLVSLVTEQSGLYKASTGGEVGITVTKHAECHYRQLIWGHYNKGCKLENPSDHPLY